MTKHTEITAVSDVAIQQWALKDTYLSDHNPRSDIAENDASILELAQTIIASGLIQNLSGLMDENGKVGIIAGGRRWRALQIAVKDRPDLAMIPVKITNDLETALSWAMLENHQRLSLSIVDEIRAYGQSRSKGLSVVQTARAYCVTEAHVRRRLALSDLPAPVLDALNAGEISLSDAKAFACSTDEARILEVLGKAKEITWWGERQIKQALNENSQDANCRAMRFVGLDAYKTAGGTLTTNLFDDDALIDDIDLLGRLFDSKLKDEAATLQARERLAWVHVTNEGSCSAHSYVSDHGGARLYPIEGELNADQQAEYDVLDGKWDWELSEDEKAAKAPLQDILDGDYSAEQRALSGAVVYVNGRGEVNATLGFVKSKDVEQAIDAGFVTPNQHEQSSSDTGMSKAEKPPYSQAFMDDLSAIRLAALQTALLQKPELVLDLLAYGLKADTRYFGRNNVMSLHFSNERNQPLQDDEGFALSPRLGGALEHDDEAGGDDEEPINADNWEAFTTFRNHGKKVRNARITESFALAMKTMPPEFMVAVEAEAGANIRGIWTPNVENCFKRMNAAQLDALYMSLLDLVPDSDKYKTFAKSKKGPKAKALSDLFNSPERDEALGVKASQRAKIDAWVPD